MVNGISASLACHIRSPEGNRGSGGKTHLFHAPGDAVSVWSWPELGTLLPGALRPRRSGEALTRPQSREDGPQETTGRMGTVRSVCSHLGVDQAHLDGLGRCRALLPRAWPQQTWGLGPREVPRRCCCFCAGNPTLRTTELASTSSLRLNTQTIVRKRTIKCLEGKRLEGKSQAPLLCVLSVRFCFHTHPLSSLRAVLWGSRWLSEVRLLCVMGESKGGWWGCTYSIPGCGPSELTCSWKKSTRLAAGTWGLYSPCNFRQL